MNAAVSVFTILGIIGGLFELIRRVRREVRQQKTDQLAVAAKLRKDTLREGYLKRSDEVKTFIDRVVDLLNSIDPPNPVVQRQVERAIKILTDNREGDPDAE